MLPPVIDSVAELQPSAEQGNAEAQYRLGVLYFRGVVVQRNDGVSADWFEKAAVQGHPASQYALGRWYEFHGTPEEAVHWYRQSAENGYAQGQFWFGQALQHGWTVPRDLAGALQWYLRAAALGHREAMLHVSKIYRYGPPSVPRNEPEGVYWGQQYVSSPPHEPPYDQGEYDQKKKQLHRLAKAGNADAQFRYALATERRTSSWFPDWKALWWYRKAAKQGHAGAQWKLGVKYRHGHGVRKNAGKGERLLLLAAEQGHSNAQYELAIHYYYSWYRWIGRSTIDPSKDARTVKHEDANDSYYWRRRKALPDPTKTAVWARRAAEQGHADAQQLLWHLYVVGAGVPQDDVEAAKWRDRLFDLRREHKPAAADPALPE